ncbi:NADH-quinone oxidoreductase subunit NuoH [Dehalococcoidia bacterium]|nr:NADH-quinone oxidoreductase subunit NuoH [Dehalococcoidia bacterium]
MTWIDVGWIVLSVVIFIGFITMVVLGLTYFERKFIGRAQGRYGPTRTGPFGLLQPVADAIKLLVKEDILPARSDRTVYWAAPLVVFVPAFVIWVSIPFTRDVVIRNLEMGLFFIFAVSGLSIVGMIMAGWGSFNKYAMLGASRTAAQLISYELPFIIATLGVAMISQSLDLRVIVAEQTWWFILLQPLAFVIFFGAGLAEVGRTPFDIPFAESEVVGGPFIEYSGMHWAMFFLAEYANTFVIAVLTTLLFLGGWRGPGPAAGWGEDVMMAFWFFFKTGAVVLVIFWIRTAIPRLRIDQLMALAWKVLIPLSFLNLLMTGFYLFYGWPNWSISLMSIAVLLSAGYVVYRRRRAQYPKPTTVTVRVQSRRVIN